MGRFAAALSLVLLASALPAQAGPTLGVNQAWIEGSFGRDLTTDWRPEEWRRVLARSRACGARVVRVWLFEGAPFEGVTWDLHRPTGLVPGFTDHVRGLGAMARQEGLSIYWTLFDGNWPQHGPSQLARDQGWNVFNDRYGYGAEFRRVALGPVLEAIMAEPGSAWGLDLINEVQGSLHGAGAFEQGWTGARRFVREWAAFVKQRAPALRVTASAGWGSASSDILMGRYDDLGLDFLDLHVYSDAGLGWLCRRAAARCRARGIPLVLGEVGQKSKAVDDALQARVLERFLRHAEEVGALAVLPWRLEDRQAGQTHFSLWDGDRPRAALAVLQGFAARWQSPLVTPGVVGSLPD